MIDIVNKNECVVCGNCVNICPKECIKFDEEFESFMYPKIDYSKCIKCEKCTKVCPALNVPKVHTKEKFYAAKNKDEEVLKFSSSGGIFYSLAKYIIDQGGCVVGAAFDNEFNVNHILVDNDEDLIKLCGSKYVQSNMDSIVKEIQKQLDFGKTVLFCGCSCQTAAVKVYFGDKYERLILIDFICHGSVSSTVFDEYKSYLEKKYNSKIKSFEFRNKEIGWLHSGLNVKFENENVYSTPLYRDLYMQGYFNNLNVKLSCYYCAYKGYKSGSDITMGDFWGIQHLIPDFYQEMGNSAISINSQIGKELWERTSNSFDFISVDKSLILQENSGLEMPFSGDFEERLKYFQKAKKVGYIKPLEKYIKNSIFKKTINWLKRVIK